MSGGVTGVGNQMNANEGFTLQVIFENSLKIAGAKLGECNMKEFSNTTSTCNVSSIIIQINMLIYYMTEEIMMVPELAMLYSSLCNCIVH